MAIKIWHNPRCSKSRSTLNLLTERGIEPAVVNYLDSPPKTSEIKDILAMLDIDARSLMRKGEAIYKELGLKDAQLSESELIQTMHDNPKLIERPIVINGDRARIGRPPENVLEILDDQ